MGRALAVAALALVVGSAAAGAAGAGTAFSNTPLIATTGTSEPAIAFGHDGSMAVDGLGWLSRQVNLWTGRFGSTPSYFGAMDTDLNTVGAARTTLGGDDADLEITASGTTLLADLDVILNPNANAAQLGVNVTRCPAGTSAPAGCTHAFLDTAGADRPWITSADGSAWVAYHDAKNSALIRVKRSTDDGLTWRPVGSPVPGQGAATGDATFNNSIGPIVADPSTGDVYESYAAGEPQTKSTSTNHNNIYVSHSTDGGRHWTSVLVFHAAPFTRLDNFWPSLALDPVTHALYTAWTDTHGVWVSSSTDGGVTWSMALEVSNATTTVMPWVAARNGKVDVAYYGSDAASTDVADAVWNTFDSQLENGAWTVKQVSNTPNRVGPVCLDGDGCLHNLNRELLDLFEVAEDPLSGRAAVVYTDSTIGTWTDAAGVTRELPEIVLAFEQ